jgi:phage head maturation protease
MPGATRVQSRASVIDKEDLFEISVVRFPACNKRLQSPVCSNNFVWTKSVLR